MNDKRLCTAGVGEHGFLSTIVDWVRRRPAPHWSENPWADGVTVRVGGSTKFGGNGENLQWQRRKLNVGDTIQIRVVEATDCDPPSRRWSSSGEEDETGARQLYQTLKARFEGAEGK